jgi:hypothetical protein
MSWADVDQAAVIHRLLLFVLPGVERDRCGRPQAQPPHLNPPFRRAAIGRHVVLSTDAGRLPQQRGRGFDVLTEDREEFRTRRTIDHAMVTGHRDLHA